MTRQYEVQFKPLIVEAENYNEAAKKADKLRPEHFALLPLSEITPTPNE